MAESVAPITQKVADSMFAIPEGLVGIGPQSTPPVLYDDNGNQIGNEFNLDEAVPEGTDIQPDSFVGIQQTSDDDFSGALDTPLGFAILEQQFHFASTGQQVVDLIVDVPEQKGALRFEFRVTKT